MRRVVCATPAARHGALLLQRRVHGAKRGRDHEIRRRHQSQTLDEAHAVERIDIERPAVARHAENAAQHDVDETDARIEQLNPGDRREQRRNRHRHEDQRGDPAPRWNGGALQEPRHEHRERQSDHQRAGGEEKSIDKDRQGRRTGQNRGVICDRHARGFERQLILGALYAGKEQHNKRHENQVGDDGKRRAESKGADR